MKNAERRAALIAEGRVEVSLSSTAAVTAIGYDDPTMSRGKCEYVDYRKVGKHGSRLTFSCTLEGVAHMLEDLDDRKDDAVGFEEEAGVQRACRNAIASITKTLQDDYGCTVVRMPKPGGVVTYAVARKEA